MPCIAFRRERMFATMVRNAGSVVDYFGLPDTYVVDPSGTIRYAIGPGATSEAQLSSVIDEVLAAQTSASSATATNSPAR